MKICADCKKPKPNAQFVARRQITGSPTRRTCDTCSRQRREYTANWSRARPGRHAKYHRNYIKSVRTAALRHYSGGKPYCACCGESTPEFLTIDHIGGGGTRHRRELSRGGMSGSAIYIFLKKREYPDGFQVLCLNCNWARGRGSACPHEKRRDVRSRWGLKITKDTRFGAWPFYSDRCLADMRDLLRRGGSLSAYRANPTWPQGPVEGSWAWHLERRSERLFGLGHVAVCASGTIALMAAIRAMRLEPGEIVTSPFSFSATPAAIRYMGYEPVFADIDPTTFCLDPASVAQVIGPRTRAILSVDLFGTLADYESLAAFGLPVIEDACQAVGASRADLSGQVRWGGGFGTVGVWSFNGAKQLPAGEAGAVVTNDPTIARRARLFLNHGENFGEIEVGLNGRLSEPVALIAYHGAAELMGRNRKRRELARVLIEILKRTPKIRSLPSVEGHALYVFPFVLESDINRPAFAKRLRQIGVEVGEGYITPMLADYPALKNCRQTNLPVVRELSGRSLCLLTQVRPPATMADMRWLGQAILAALDGAAPQRITPRSIGSTPLEDI